MERNIKELFQKTGESLQAIGESLQAIYEYFKLKDKVLWTGSAGRGQTISVPDVGKYNSISVLVDGIQILCQETFGNEFYGSVVNSSPNASEFYARTVSIERISDDSIKILVATESGVNISAGSQATVTKIIGVEPKF